MARSRLYLMPEDHDHFLRIFPEARALPWTHFPEAGYWRVEFDPDAPTPAEIAALGDSRAICLERLGRLGYTEPPAEEEDVDPGAPGGAYAGDGAGPPLARPFLLLLLILTVVGSGTVFLISRGPAPMAVPSPKTAESGRSEPEAASPSDPMSDPAGVSAFRPLDADIIALLDQCRRYFQNGNLTVGEADDALECYRRVLAHVPDNMEALGGLRRIEKHFIARAEAALNRSDPAAAGQFLAFLDRVNPDSVHLARLWEDLERLRKRPPASAVSSEPPPEETGPIPAESAGVSSSPPASSVSGSGAERRPDSGSAGAGSADGGNGEESYDTDALIRESLGTGFEPTGEGAD